MHAATQKMLFLGLALVVILGGLGWILFTGVKVESSPNHLALSDAGARSIQAKVSTGNGSDLGGALPAGLDRSAVNLDAIGVRVSGSGGLAGRVVERTSGSGAAGVQVALFTYPPQGSGFLNRVMKLGKTSSSMAKRVLPIAKATTDDTGAFEFSGVRSGSYFAEARGEFFIPDPIERVSLGTEGPEATLFVRAGGRVEGRVTLGNGKPAKHARVHVGHGEGRIIEAVRSGEVMEKAVFTNDDGFYWAGGIPAGTGMQVAASRDDAGLVFARNLTVAPGEVLRVDLRFEEPAGLSGRVVSKDMADRGEELALAGARLAVVPRGLIEMQFVDDVMQASAATSSAKGEFKISALPGGSVDLLAWAPGHMPARLGPLPTTPGVQFDVGTVALERGAMATGRVIDAQGHPIEAVQVRWRPVTFDGDLELSFAPLLSQAIEGFEFPVTDSDGRFQAGPFPGKPKHRMDFYRDGFTAAQASWSGESGDEVLVTMYRGASVSGLVLDATTKKPVTRFTISGSDRVTHGDGGPAGWNPFGGGQLVEDPQGQFQVPAVRKGKSTLDFSADGYQTRRIDDIDVTEGVDSTGVLVLLEPGATVRGTVVDGEGEPVGGVRVAARLVRNRASRMSSAANPKGLKSRGRNVPNGTSLRYLPSGFLPFAIGTGLIESSLSDGSGQFELRGLGAGSWKLVATHQDFARGIADPVEIVLKEREAAPLIEGHVVTMQAGSRLVGVVRDGRGAKLAGAMVVAFAPPDFGGAQDSGGAYQGVTDRQGNYVIENMVGGGYFLVVTRGDEHADPFSFLGTMQMDLVTMPFTGELRRDLIDHSAAATRVNGIVYKADQAVRGGTLFAFNMDTESMLGADVKLASVGLDGSYSFPGLGEGLYQFRYQNGGELVGREVEVPDRVETRIDLHLPGGVLSGKVVAAGTGEGIRGARVVARPLGHGFELEGLLGAMLGGRVGLEEEYTDSDGHFLIGNLQDGRYAVEVSGPRWGGDSGRFSPSVPIEIEVVEGLRSNDLTVELEASLEILGHVRAADGTPIAHAYITVASADANGMEDSLDMVRSDLNGAFTVRGVGTEAYRLDIGARGFVDISMSPVRAGGDPIDVVLWRGVEVNVRILDAQGKPAVGATAQLLREASAGASSGETLSDWFEGRALADLDGLVELGRFTPGRYRLEASRGEAKAVIDAVHVPEVGEVNLEVQLH